MKALIIFFFHEKCFKSKWESVGRNTSRLQFKCCENNHYRSTVFQNDPPTFTNSWKTSPHFSVTLSHIANSSVGQGLTLTLVRYEFNPPGHFYRFSYSIITGQTINNAVINIRCWRCPRPSSPILSLPYPNSWLESLHTLSFSPICVHWNCVYSIYKNLSGLKERYLDSQPR